MSKTRARWVLLLSINLWSLSVPSVAAPISRNDLEQVIPVVSSSMMNLPSAEDPEVDKAQLEDASGNLAEEIPFPGTQEDDLAPPPASLTPIQRRERDVLKSMATAKLASLAANGRPQEAGASMAIARLTAPSAGDAAQDIDRAGTVWGAQVLEARWAPALPAEKQQDNSGLLSAIRDTIVFLRQNRDWLLGSAFACAVALVLSRGFSRAAR